MKRRGFSFLEVLIALAILAVLSASLMPLMTRLAAADRRVRLRDEAWRTAQAGLTARYLGDRSGWKALENGPLRIALESTSTAGGVGWNKLTVTPPETGQPLVMLYLESEIFRPAGRP
jgi:prepilin-type N-terminal cleavage/methylation domain-containing protein